MWKQIIAFVHEHLPFVIHHMHKNGKFQLDLTGTGFILHLHKVWSELDLVVVLKFCQTGKKVPPEPQRLNTAVFTGWTLSPREVVLLCPFQSFHCITGRMPKLDYNVFLHRASLTQGGRCIRPRRAHVSSRWGWASRIHRCVRRPRPFPAGGHRPPLSSSGRADQLDTTCLEEEKEFSMKKSSPLRNNMRSRSTGIILCHTSSIFLSSSSIPFLLCSVTKTV